MCKSRTDKNTVSKGSLDDSVHDSHDSHFSLFNFKSEKGYRQLPLGYLALVGGLLTLLCFRKAITRRCKKSFSSSAPHPPPTPPQMPSSPPYPAHAAYEMQALPVPVHQARLPIFPTSTIPALPPIYPMHPGIEAHHPLYTSTPAHQFPIYQEQQSSFNPAHPLVKAITKTLDRRSFRKKCTDPAPSTNHRAATTQVRFDQPATDGQSSSFKGILGEEDY